MSKKEKSPVEKMMSRKHEKEIEARLNRLLEKKSLVDIITEKGIASKRHKNNDN